VQENIEILNQQLTMLDNQKDDEDELQTEHVRAIQELTDLKSDFSAIKEKHSILEQQYQNIQAELKKRIFEIEENEQQQLELKTKVTDATVPTFFFFRFFVFRL
jgi:predicted  nucleic acid-binding Zn-ribbon protein